MIQRIFLVCAAAVCVAAQTPPPTQSIAVSQQKGDSELGFFAGAVIPPGSGDTKFGGGVNYAYALDKYFYPYAEFSVLPGALNDSTTLGNSRFTTKGNLADFHGGLHLRIPVSNRFVPYGVIAVGGFRSYSSKFEEFDIQKNSVVRTTGVASQTSFAVNYGGGVRYYINNSVGVRFEVKAYGPNSKFGGAPVRIMGGVFYQFKKK